MEPAQLDLAHLEGGSFSLRDLRVALWWAGMNPSVRLQIMLDHPDISEVIEICTSLDATPRWLIWSTLGGQLRVIDLVMANFAVPYLTVDSALRYIGSTL